MHFLIRETLSFNLMYVAACYPVGTTISKTSSLFTALLQHYRSSGKLGMFCFTLDRLAFKLRFPAPTDHQGWLIFISYSLTIRCFIIMY